VKLESSRGRFESRFRFAKYAPNTHERSRLLAWVLIERDFCNCRRFIATVLSPTLAVACKGPSQCTDRCAQHLVDVQICTVIVRREVMQ